jgi:hypothetical protein
MQIQIFNVQLTDGGEGLSEMNRFLMGHKVLEIEQRFFSEREKRLLEFLRAVFTYGNGFSGRLSAEFLAITLYQLIGE